MARSEDAFRVVASALLVGLATACASVAPLDDAELTGLALASPKDLARYERTKERRSREIFGGASFSDGRGNIVASFDAQEYDEYLAYLRDHRESAPGSDLRSALLAAESAYPVLRLTFKTSRVLFQPRLGSGLKVSFHLCDEEGDERRLPGLGPSEVLWRGRFLNRGLVEEIEVARQADTSPQEYEVFFSYRYSGQDTNRRRGEPERLMPLPGDLCLALIGSNHPLPKSEGRPLRIDEGVVKEALGPLPRPVTLP